MTAETTPNGSGRARTGGRRLKLFARLILAGWCAFALVAAGCGREKPVASGADRQPAGEPGRPGAGSPDAAGLRGTVAGTSFVVRDAVFFWYEGADDLTVMLSDTPGLCARMKDGAMPRGGDVLMLMLKHNSRELRDAPFGHARYPLRAPEGERLPRDLKNAVFLRLDAGCGNTLPAADVRPVEGEVVLDAVEAKDEGFAKGRVKLVLGPRRDVLEGAFSAAYCRLPDDATEPRGCR
jgi:hypothetical protein